MKSYCHNLLSSSPACLLDHKCVFYVSIVSFILFLFVCFGTSGTENWVNLSLEFSQCQLSLAISLVVRGSNFQLQPTSNVMVYPSTSVKFYFWSQAYRCSFLFLSLGFHFNRHIYIEIILIMDDIKNFPSISKY